MNRILKTAISISLISAVIFMSSLVSASEDMDFCYFLKRLCSEDSWLYPIPDEQAFMASSNQPVNKRDCNAFLRKEPSGRAAPWNVLVDLKGPGVITRIWTAGDFNGDLEFIIDSSLALKTPMKDFFGGKTDGFPKPLVLDDRSSSGGRVSYVPVPFGKRIIIRSNAATDSFYWQINYSIFDEDARVLSFTGDITSDERVCLSTAAEKFSGTVESPTGASYSKEEFKLDLLPGKTASQVFIGRGIIRSLKISMPGDFWKYAADIAFSVNCDGEITPSVEVALPDIVHLSSKLKTYDSMYSSFDGRTLVFLMPIPFENGLKINLINNTAHSFQDGTIEILTDRQTTRNMRLHILTRREQPEFGKMITLENIEGAGVFAGLNLTTQAPVSIGEIFSNQEGNEYITLDQGKNTIWKGTGTEDYFNSGYFYREGEVSNPLSGCLDKRQIDGGRISSYRIHKLDAVPFKNGLLFSIEPGCPKKGADKIGRFHLDYRWTTFWYAEKK